MSVINKMLRDLDQRQSPATGAADPLRRDTSSLTALPRLRRPSPALRWATLLLPLAAAVAGGFVWWSFQHVPVPAPVAPAAIPAPAPAPAVALAVPVAAAEPAEAAASAAQEVVLATPATAPSAVVAAVVPALPAPVPAQVRPEVATPVPTQKTAVVTTAPPVPAPPPAPAVPVAAKPPAPVPEVPSAAARQQQAGREALAQAQALWASGARDAAISSLQEAVAVAERGTQGVAGTSVILVPLVRELARMELAEGRPAAVWDLLQRLEPLLANQPELWALRANAAQRLGRHQDSVLAYTTALQTRPGEQRWLLGAAVSLAALGQTAPAADMAEKARTIGPVSREVLAYLRQQGVPLTDRP